ncbi:MAG: aldo/keto reductase [Streptosporangiaceae bacterium]
MDSLTHVSSRVLGSAGLAVPAIGLGCMGFSQAYGPADDEASIATIRRAIDLGAGLLDTAMSYGAGHNEELVGRAIQGRRDQVVLATKFGIIRGKDRSVRIDGRPENVRGYCEASLRRLGVGHIDLYYQHRIDPEVPVEETIGAMAALVDEGNVRYLGVSEATPDELARAFAVHPVTAVQCEWSLWWREVEDDVVPAARRLGIGIVAYSPLGRGFLTGAVATDGFGAEDFRRHDPRFTGADLTRNEAALDAVGALAAKRGASQAQLTLAWLLAQGKDVVAIPGTRRQRRVQENVAAAALELSSADLDRIEQIAPRSAWAGDRQSFAARHTVRSGCCRDGGTA